MALYARALQPAPSRWPVSALYDRSYENNAANQNLRDSEREFFKLPKILLRSEVDGKPVDAIIEGGQHERDPRSTSLGVTAAIDGSREASAVTIQNQPLPSMSVQQQKSPQDRRHEFPAVRTVPTQHPQPKPTVHDRDQHNAMQSRHAERAVPLGSSVNGHVRTNGPAGTVTYPSTLSVKLDAIDRLQTQANLNRANLESCTRDIARLEGSFRLLHTEFKDTVEQFRMELIASRQHVVAAAHAIAPQGDRLDEQALEVFSTTLSQVVNKTSEVDALKVQFEMIKRKIKRLEEGQNVSLATAAPPTYHPHRRQSSLYQQTPIIQHPGAGSAQHISATARHLETPTLGSYPPQRVAYTPENAHQPSPYDQEPSAAGGWISVNTGTKRGRPVSMEERADIADTPVGSPKRLKLTPLEPRYTYEASNAPGSIQFERMDTDESIPSKEYRTESNESYPDSTNASTFVPYTQEGPPDDSWRPVSQRAVSNPAPAGPSPRGRGRGRGGRPRKSLTVKPHPIGTPEWEKEGWNASQVEADGYYRGGVVRRGSGGGLSGVPLSPSSLTDPYGHTKKSRTRPIRNSDGVLIRKDGRPDQRSQSSAANLRKVHAKKEEERRDGVSVGPTSGLAGEPMMRVDGPASTDSRDEERSESQERARDIMRQMFPHGVAEERGKLYTAQQYFPSDRSRTEQQQRTQDQRIIPESELDGDSPEPSKSREPSRDKEDAHIVDQAHTSEIPVADVATVPTETAAPVSTTESQTLDNDTPPLQESFSRRIVTPPSVPANLSKVLF